MPDLLGTFRYGSEHVTMTADSTRAPGLGTFGWDDEGVPAQRSVLVDQGLFTGLPVVARDCGGDRPAEQRRHARRRLVAAADHPHDQHQPRSRERRASRR